MIVVAIPAFNEEQRVGATVRAAVGALKDAFPGHDVVALVVDDGSSDATAEAARVAGARVTRLDRNVGKGRALRALLYEREAPLVARADVVLLLDADLEEAAREAPLLVQPVLEGEVDMTVAAFPPATRKGGFGFVKRLAARAVSEACGFEPRSPVSGQRALAPRLLGELAPAFEYGFGLEVALSLRACRAGARVREVATSMRHRETGRDLGSFLHRFRQYRDIKRVIRDFERERGAA